MSKVWPEVAVVMLGLLLASVVVGQDNCPNGVCPVSVPAVNAPAQKMPVGPAPVVVTPQPVMFPRVAMVLERRPVRTFVRHVGCRLTHPFGGRFRR